ncbi:hypothetical protein FRB99_006340 [Tulasnella sp. 403]|nr:hypothetical protein FRB99_006340 [Tulasnella sp. 403]
MTVTEYIDQLIGLRPPAFESAEDVLRDIEDWETSQAAGPGDVGFTADGESEEEPPSIKSTTLSLFKSLAGKLPTAGDEISILVARLRSKPQLENLLTTLGNILVSDKPDEEIYGEVLDLAGYDDVEGVGEVVRARQGVGRELLGRGGDEKMRDQAAEDALLERGVGGGKKGKGKGKFRDDAQGERNYRQSQNDGGVSFTAADSRRRMEESFTYNANRPLYSGTAELEPEPYPHVYTMMARTPAALAGVGMKSALPLGTERHDNEFYEEVTIPPSRPIPPKATERLIPINELDPLARGSFLGYTSLNRMQSIVYKTVYTTNENLLICAPTGAGKTDIAMLSILRVLDQYRTEESAATIAASIRKDDFKIIYVAPMKALAAEIVRKLGKRLAWLSIRVRELTGDMQMTRAEIAETQIIVTTPEKWDVVTRKPTGEGELALKVKLLIIDEVHLLNEERGAVIETIVARTLRLVESSQSVIRIVGLSATLPNYIDVADFLGVSRYEGLFYFDSSFRPVPLEQHFIGIKGKPGSPQQKRNTDRITYDKVYEMVHQGHQVMVFVHARKETVKSAMALREMIMLEGTLDEFDPTEHPQWDTFRREIGTSRNKEMKELFDYGFGIHHAGMLRADRNMMEKMFEARAIKVLFCTATLAWGVNLPAHAVLIKGTQVYDSAQGKFVDLSVLDVLQIFGRAGRPGMESSGVGFICTPDEKLDHYVNAVTSQHAIESKFVGGLVDALNAEISLGTVANVNEGVQWLGYTYLFVRMQKNPMVYGMFKVATLLRESLTINELGIRREDLINDPQLGSKRLDLITLTARKLSQIGMITFDEKSGAFAITDLGIIAAKYYIRHTSIEIFNQKLKPKMSEADVLNVLSMSTEFDQIQVRENEIPELTTLMHEVIPCEVQGGTDTNKGKVNILLQGYISKAYVEDFALVSDTAYAAQNGGRIIRALLEIALSRKWASATTVLMAMSKAVEKRMWPYEHPLTQTSLSRALMYNLKHWADEMSIHDLASQTAAELGKLIHLNEIQGEALLRAAKEFPTAAVTYTLRPLSPDLLKISVDLKRAFKWNKRVHGITEPFWVWVEDHEGREILQWSHMTFRQNTDHLSTNFTIPLNPKAIPPSVTIRFVSDKWLGAEEEIVVPFNDVTMPGPSSITTPLLNIPFLMFKTLRNPTLEKVYAARYRNMNGIQTQCFFSLYNTAQNVLVSAPSASGKGVLAQFAAWRALFSHPQPDRSLVLIVCPDKSSAKQMLSSFKPFEKFNLHVQLASTIEDLTKATSQACVRITTPRAIILSLSTLPTDSLSAVVCTSLHLLDAKYELALSLLQHATQSHPVRYIALTSSLTNPIDLATWLNIAPTEQSLYHFPPSTRESPIKTTTHTFTIHHSAALFKSMIKPVHGALRSMDTTEGGLVFVPSRTLCKSVAGDLITQCAIEMDTRGFLPADVDDGKLEYVTARVRDKSLVDPILHGIGILFNTLPPTDQALVLELFAEGIIRVLIMPREQCWIVPLRASLVVVMGTQYLKVEPDDERRLVNYTFHEVVKMQSLAARYGKSGKFMLLCHVEERDTFVRFLDQGLPLESSLAESEEFAEWVKEEITKRSMKTKQDLMDMLSFTYLAQRVRSNPTYYEAEPERAENRLSRLVDQVWQDPPPALPSEDTLGG